MALQFMVDVSFVMGPLSPGTGRENRARQNTEDESDQLLILAVTSKVLTVRYVLPQWATMGLAYAKQKKDEDTWW